MNGFMAIPNLIALILLSPIVFSITKDFFNKTQVNENPLSRVKKDVKLALKEDLQNNDISLLGLKDRKVFKKAYLISREDAYICGVDWFNESFKQVAKRYRNQKNFS